MLHNLSRRCLIRHKAPENTRVYIISMPKTISSFVVRKDDYYTICISDALTPEGRIIAYNHEVDHINNGDFDSNDPTGLIEIRAHRRDREEKT